MEQDIPESVMFRVQPGNLITILDWRTNLLIRVMAGNEPSWDAQREGWIFPYIGGPEVPGYAIWVKDHWEDGEH